MKKGLLLSALMYLLGAQIVVDAQELKVSDVQNSGCMRETREKRAKGYEETQTIILTKEGIDLKVQLLNYYSNCGTEGFEVTSNMSGGNNGSPLLLAVGVTPICNVDMDCICPYNVSFTINGVESNSFYFKCWWCEGMVNLTEGEPLVVKDNTQDVSIDGLEYTIHETMHTAKLKNGKSWEGELKIPSEVSYEGQKYAVINIITSAFSENTALTSITIPNSITSIGGAAFYGCTGLTSIIIPESVKNIGYNVFYGCTNLANITIPNSVSSIGTEAFTGTAWYNNLPDGVVYIGYNAYTYKGNMPEETSITIKEGTSKINQEAFSRCSNLTSVTIPSSVTSIGNDAFWKCSGLTSVTIAEGVKSIGYMAFGNCDKLTYINIPESVTTIGEFAFRECSNLTSISIPKGVKKIGRYAFEGCKNLTSLVISEGVKDLGYMAFSGCYSLSSVTIPGSVTTIGQSVFAGCSGLTSVIISEGVQVIDVGAFEGCSSLTSLTIPSSVTTIYDYAFYRCSRLTEVKCNASVPPVCYDWVFYDVPLASATLHVPAASVDLYKASEPWSGFGNIVAIEEMAQEYFPEGTKWTEIRLDTLKYDSWYSKVGDEWVPNFETVEYYVKGTYPYFSETFGDNSLKCVYSNSQEWIDSLSLLIHEGIINEYDNYERGVMATVPVYLDYWDVPFPASAYNFDWRVGMAINFIDILSTNVDLNPDISDFGIIEEIKEGNFGGVKPLKYTEINGVRIIQGIGVTTWNDGECLFGPVKPYRALSFFKEDFSHNERHYRSMLVHFERNGEVLYDVWPLKGSTVEVTIDGLNYFLNLKTHEAILTARHTCSGEVNIPSEVNYNGETFIVKSMNCHAFYENKEITKVKIPKTLAEIIHYYPYDPDLQAPTGLVNPIYMNPFKGCTALESIEVDEENPNFKSINGVLYSQDDGGQFRNTIYSGTGLFCYPLGIRQESYTIPDGVKFVFGNAFYQNKDLTKLILPSSTKAIYDEAFCGCTNLKDVYCYAENPPVGYYVFENTPIASATLYVLASSVDEYKKSSTWKGFGSIVALPDPVTFTENQMATIILPTAPDASKGKYYRLDRCEDGKIIFEEELNPKARTPYIIVPNEDFNIDLNTLDLAGLSQDTVSIKGISFIGSYTSKRLESKEGWYVDIIDTTPDCSLSPSGETEKGAFLIGSLRAFLQVSWDDPYHPGGTRGREEKLEIVLEDNSNGIAEMKNERTKSEKYTNDIYDLSGRKLFNGQSSMVNGLKKGIYIQDGKKVVK